MLKDKHTVRLPGLLLLEEQPIVPIDHIARRPGCEERGWLDRRAIRV